MKNDENRNLPKRKSTRLKNFNYSNTGAYFVTICTKNRKRILSYIPHKSATDLQLHLDDTQNKENKTVGGDVLDAPHGVPGDTQNKENKTVGGDVLDAPQSIKLLPCGKIVDKFIKQLNDFYDDINVDQYVIMPNHIHIMLFVLDNGASRTSLPTARQHSAVSQFVSTLKRFCNREYGENIFQTSFHDHIIRDREDYETRRKYIHENPARWEYDELYVEG